MKMSVSPMLALELAQQVEDLCLDRDVERRHRLVGDQQLGLERDRAGDADPLALAAGELVRIAVVVLGVEPDAIHQLLDAALALAVARVQPVDDERVGDDRARPSCAGSATSTGPGRPSACRGAAP